MIPLTSLPEGSAQIFGTDLDTFIYERFFPNLLIIFLYIVIGSLLLKGITRILSKNIGKKLNPQSRMLIIKFANIVGTFVIIMLVLNRLEVPLSAILGAAGIATVAIGIASQNSMGNVISGIFLISEHSFVVGDIIQVGANIGTVVSIDLLSVKLRNFDGVHLRIPNETLIKSEINTITKNLTRRVALEISISYYDSIELARDVLLKVADEEPLALKDPAPFFMVAGYGPSGINLFFGVWGETRNFAMLKTALLIKIKQAFDANGIEIPFPHITIRPPVSFRKESDEVVPVPEKDPV